MHFKGLTYTQRSWKDSLLQWRNNSGLQAGYVHFIEVLMHRSRDPNIRAGVDPGVAPPI